MMSQNKEKTSRKSTQIIQNKKITLSCVPKSLKSIGHNRWMKQANYAMSYTQKFNNKLIY